MSLKYEPVSVTTTQVDVDKSGTLDRGEFKNLLKQTVNKGEVIASTLHSKQPQPCTLNP